MHRHTGRFVDGEQVVVLKQHRKFARRCRFFELLGNFVGHPHRRHTHCVPYFHPRVGGGAAFVDTHLTTADDAVHVGLGHPFQDAEQEVIEALACGIFIDHHLLNGGRCGGG